MMHDVRTAGPPSPPIDSGKQLARREIRDRFNKDEKSPENCTPRFEVEQGKLNHGRKLRKPDGVPYRLGCQSPLPVSLILSLTTTYQE